MSSGQLEGWPSRGRSRYCLAVLCALAILSYLDRYIVAVVAEPLIHSMKLDATDVGFLIGLGFGPVYALMSLPIAYFLDRGNRVRIVGGGVVLWSLSTIASAFAYDFSSLLSTRIGVAIGEAVLVPATVSLIADLYPPAQRSRAIAIFMSVSTLMTAGAFTLGGLAYAQAEILGQAFGTDAWRLTFVFVGFPGLLLAALWFATVREPARVMGENMSQSDASMGAVLKHLRSHIGFYFPFLITFAVSALTSYSFISWTTAILFRSYGFSVADAAFYYGTIGLIAAAIGAFLWPTMAGWFISSGRPAANVVALAIGLTLGHLSVALLGQLDTNFAAIVAIMLAIFGFAAGGGLAVVIIQTAAPPRMRAKITSFYMLMGNLVGLTLGPPLTAWLSENWFEGRHALRESLATLAGLSAPIVLVAMLGAAYAYRSLVKSQNS